MDAEFDANRSYIILQSTDPQTLDDYVNKAIDSGYWPVGSPFADRWDSHSGAVSFYQAVTRKKKRHLVSRYAIRPNPVRSSYCAVHNSYPDDGEPCYGCINKALLEALKPN